MKKSIIFILALVFTITAVPGQMLASESDSASSSQNAKTEQSRLQLITTIMPSLRVSGTTATYTLYVTCISSVNSITANMQIQQYSGGRWVNYGASWVETSSTSYLIASGTKTVASGHSYRLKVVITASNGSSSSTVTEYS